MERRTPAFQAAKDFTSLSLSSFTPTKASYTTQQVQTEETKYQDAEIQTVERHTVQVQTESLGYEDDASMEQAMEKAFHEQADSIAAFLRTVSPMMLRQLHRNLKNTALNNYVPSQMDEDEESKTIFEFAYAFSQPSETASEENQLHILPCTCLSWNATGSSICAGFGRVDLSGWDTTASGVVIWNIMRQRSDSTKVGDSQTIETLPADLVLETTSSVASVSCHPKYPSILAAGTYSGEVLVWDTNFAEPLIAKTEIDDYFHREPVTSLCWFQELGSKEYLLASVSGDGKLLIWTLESKLKYPVAGFVLESRMVKGRQKHAAILGGTTISASHEKGYSGNLLVGTESGHILRSLTRSHTQKRRQNMKPPGAELVWSNDSGDLLTRVDPRSKTSVIREVERYARQIDRGADSRPVDMKTLFDARPDPQSIFPSMKDFVYESHAGPVSQVDYSPFHRNIFLSCGHDGKINIFNQLQQKPLTHINPSPATLNYTFSGVWSRIRPLVFSAASGDGNVYIYDLAKSIHVPNAVLGPSVIDPTILARTCITGSNAFSTHGTHFYSHSEKETPAYAVCFNPHNRKLLATSDGAGRVRIHRLGWSLSNTFDAEMKLFNRFANLSISE